MARLDRHLTHSAVAAAVVRAMPDAAVAIVDHQLKLTWAAGAPLERVRWRSEDIVGCRLADLLPQPIYDQVARCCLTALAGQRGETEILSPRRGRRHALVVEPLLGAEGETLAALAVLRDPVEARAEAEDEDPDARFDLLFDTAPIGMALLATDGRTMRVNAALCELVGRSEPELLAGAFDDIVHPEDTEAGLRQAEALLAGEVAEYGGERRLRHADGVVLHVVVRVSLAPAAGSGPDRMLVQVTDASERRRFEYRLQELAERDPLTGLPNRPYFERELDHRVEGWRRAGTPAALLLLDLDHFKYVNDAHGHRVGDELLRRVAARVRAALPGGTVVARLGGDELAALVPGTAGATAERVAERLVAAIRMERLTVGDDVLGTTASVGVAEVGAAASDAEGVLVAADLAMYRAKASGGDRAVLHDPADGGREQVSADLRWSQRIRSALEEERFELHAQPVVDARTGAPVKYELLVRLRDADGSLIAPGAFLPHAERFGLVGEIDRWVVGEAVGLAARLDVTLAMNLSGRSVGDPTLLGFVEEAIAGAGLDPRRLVFEVTETAAIASMGDAQRLAIGLRALGCGFALDDFGAGFASFTYVKQLPFDYLKIDGSFVRDLPESPADRVVVSALVDVARGLGKRTVAEFVCSPEVLAEVRSCGVDLVQGHHVGAAAPLEAWVGAVAG